MIRRVHAASVARTALLALVALAPAACRPRVCYERIEPDTANNGSTAVGSSATGSGSSGGAFAGGPVEFAPPQNAAVTGDNGAQRAIAEADIVELGAKYLYAMSKSGTLAIVDVSVPGHLTLVGSVTLPGQPFEMYERGQTLVAMCNDVNGPAGGAAADGGVVDAAASFDAGAVAVGSPAIPATTGTGSTTVDNQSAGIFTLDVSDPTHVATLATFQVPGQIADSRIIGDVLYLATYKNGSCYGCDANSSTLVSTFDVTDPTQMKAIDHVEFVSNAPADFNAAWGMAWKRSIVATPQRLYLGGLANVDPNAPLQSQGIIDVLDVSDPAGHLVKGAHLSVPGPILSRWQMDETGGVLRVVSQHGAAFTGNGDAAPEVDTFTIASTNAFVPLGRTTLQLPSQEGLRTVQFDGPRAYAITFNQTDPLFTIDLSNPALPVQRGSLMMPGWMFYLQPVIGAQQVIGLGVDRTDPGGSLNVSLFDVSNLDAPTMLSRVPFGALGVGEDYSILNYELPEDQDHIQKAFRVFPDGLVAVPFSSSGNDGTDCANPLSGVQLLSLSGKTLVKHAVLPISGNPRRALELGSQLLAVSDSDVASYSLANLDVAAKTADVTIGTCVAAQLPGQYGGGWGGGGDYFGGDYVDNDASAPNQSSPSTTYADCTSGSSLF